MTEEEKLIKLEGGKILIGRARRRILSGCCNRGSMNLDMETTRDLGAVEEIIEQIIKEISAKNEVKA